MLFAQRGPTMVLRDHRWPTLCEAGAKVGELTAAPLIWSRPGEDVQKCEFLHHCFPKKAVVLVSLGRESERGGGRTPPPLRCSGHEDSSLDSCVVQMIRILH